MLISIIIRTKDEEENVGQVLKNIYLQKIEQKFEVIVIDSGSTDKTIDIARQYDVKIINIPASRFTYGYSLNYGIQNSSGDIICCLSAHCIPYNDKWLSELVNPILESKVHATYGRQIPLEEVNPFEELFLQKHFPEDEKKGGRVSFSNANCAFIRRMWDEMKFDECIPGWEDYLWYLLIKNKFKFHYVRDACVTHSHPFSLNRIARTAYQDGKALRYIKDKYDFNILERTSSTIGKFRYVIKDLSSHIVFFLKKGYTGSVLILPFVKFYSYLNYWRGYHSDIKGFSSLNE
jgi:glycosyltransferase involved in cell wall biosynthesis